MRCNKIFKRTAIRATNTTRSLLTKTKPENENQKTKNCIYKVPCECERLYIGETGRPLQVRIKEHQKLVAKGETDKSRLAQHVWDEHHRVKWDEASIIAKEDRTKKRKLKEAAFMVTTNNTISTPSIQLSNIWLPVVRSNL